MEVLKKKTLGINKSFFTCFFNNISVFVSRKFVKRKHVLSHVQGEIGI